MFFLREDPYGKDNIGYGRDDYRSGLDDSQSGAGCQGDVQPAGADDVPGVLYDLGKSCTFILKGTVCFPDYGRQIEIDKGQQEQCIQLGVYVHDMADGGIDEDEQSGEDKDHVTDSYNSLQGLGANALQDFSAVEDIDAHASPGDQGQQDRGEAVWGPVGQEHVG